MSKNNYIKIFIGSVIILIVLYLINCYLLEKSAILAFDDSTGAIKTTDGPNVTPEEVGRLWALSSRGGNIGNKLDVLENTLYCAPGETKTPDGACKVALWTSNNYDWTYSDGNYYSNYANTRADLDNVKNTLKNTVKWTHDQDQLEKIASMDGGIEKLNALGWEHITLFNGKKKWIRR